MQARSSRRKAPRRHQAGGHRAKREDRMLDHPTQNPPVDRLYMRPIVGRRGRPDAPRQGAKASGAKHATPGGDYMVELTTFHVRPRWRP